MIALSALGIAFAQSKLAVFADDRTDAPLASADSSDSENRKGDDEPYTTFKSSESFLELPKTIKKKSEALPPKDAASTSPEPKKSFDYDAEIQKARSSGDPLKASILEECRDTPSGGTLTLPSAFAALMRQYCPERDFQIVIDKSYSSVNGTAQASPPSQAEKNEDKTAACRAEARKHIITCAKVTDYQNCETWGCPEVIQCDKRLTSCDDHGAPYDRSGNFYCDMRDWRTRDFDLEAVLKRACPTQ